MYKLLADLSRYLKRQEITTDSMVFRLHNNFTTVLLFTCSLVITATQYVGNPISCIVQGLPTHVINTYCWITSTFTMPDAFNRQVRAYVCVRCCSPNEAILLSTSSSSRQRKLAAARNRALCSPESREWLTEALHQQCIALAAFLTSFLYSGKPLVSRRAAVEERCHVREQ